MVVNANLRAVEEASRHHDDNPLELRGTRVMTTSEEGSAPTALEQAVQAGMAVIDWDAYHPLDGGGLSAAEAAEESIRAALDALRVDVDLSGIGDIHISTVLRVLRAAGFRPVLGVEFEVELDIRQSGQL